MKTITRQRRLLLAGAVAVLALLLLGGMSIMRSGWFPPEDSASGEHDPEQRARDARHSRSLSRQSVFDHADDPEWLESMVGEAIRKGLLRSSDRELVGAFSAHFGSFSAETLAALFNSSVLTFQIRNHLLGIDDLERFSEVVGFMEEGSRKANFLQHSGGASPLFTPDALERTIGQLPPLTDVEWKQIAFGVRSRIFTESDPDLKRQLVIDYLTTTRDHPILYTQVARSATEVMTTDEAIAWLSASTTDLSRDAERSFLMGLDEQDYGKGIEFINHLLDGGDTARGQEALQAFVSNYSRARPRESFDWVMSLDPDLRNEEMILWPFTSIKRANEAEALEIIESTDDPELRTLLEGFMER